MFCIFGTLSNTQKLLGLVVAGTVALGVLTGVASVFPNASNQGYDPKQPIPFSHRIHAGDLKMDCKYCHVGVTESRHATIPALSVCMNCHTEIKTDSPHIQKLTQHFNENRPVEWIRIHELPDFVAFNHRPHISAGVSCETCHGDVAKMEQVYQHAPLNMGWCMQCHRGETTPPHVLVKKFPEKLDLEGRHPVAPVNCSTCHF